MRILLIILLITSFIYAKEKVIGVGFFKSKQALQKRKELLKDYSLYVKPHANGMQLYIIDLGDEFVPKVFKKLKKTLPDVFITNIEMQKEPLKQKKEVVVLKKNPLKVKRTATLSDEYKKALYLYRQKKYALSYEAFSKLSNTIIDPVKVDFYLGRSAYEIGNYDAALAAYERVTINDPKNLRVRLEIAQTYIKMKMYKAAKKEFLAVLKKDIPKNVRKNIQLNIDMIDQKIKKHFVNVVAILGVGYDSNINNGTDPGDYSIYIPQLNSVTSITATDKTAAMTYESGLIVNHTYKKSQSFIVENSFMFYLLHYPKYKTKDLQLISLNVAPAYIKGSNKFALGFYADKIWYGYYSLMSDYALKPKYMRIISKEMLYTLEAKIGYKYFSKSVDKQKDAKVYELSNTLNMKTKKYGSLKANLILGEENRVRGTRTDVTKDYYSITLSDSYPINKKFMLSGSINSYFTGYNYKDVNFLNKRKDEKHTASLGVTNLYSKKLTLSINAQYINQISNEKPFDYTKYIIKSSLVYVF